MSEPRWPMTIAYGIETYYCPQCMTAEPDGDPDPFIWEEVGEACCTNCVEKTKKEWNL